MVVWCSLFVLHEQVLITGFSRRTIGKAAYFKNLFMLAFDKNAFLINERVRFLGFYIKKKPYIPVPCCRPSVRMHVS